MIVKICGITNEADAKQAALLGADAIGLNFYSQSPRFVTEDVADSILRALPPLGEAIGVFVNEPLKTLPGGSAAASEHLVYRRMASSATTADVALKVSCARKPRY